MRLDELAIVMRQCARGMEKHGLSPVHFYSLQDAALNGTITGLDLAKVVDQDYANGEDGLAGSQLLFDALLADLKTISKPST